jgi:peptide/nickel transport system permease protein
VTATTFAGPVIAPRRDARSGRGRVLAAAAAVVVTFWIVAAVAWPWLAPHDPYAQDPALIFRPPSLGHPFGTDGFGRDVFSRVLAGARPVLVVAPLAVLIATIAGTTLGLVAGYERGLVDSAAMRLLESIAVLPPLFPVILVVALLGSSTAVLVGVIAFAFVPLVTWSVRAATLVERQRGYVDAAIVRGESRWYVMGREILPNVAGPISVEATVRLADAVFAIATLSFVGLGAPPGSTDWGAQVADNRVNLQFAWWAALFPALAVASLVVSVSLVADVIRERWDRAT